MEEEMPFDRVALVVVDGVGCGPAHDTASNFPRDLDSNSLLNASRVHAINAPGLQRMGLANIPGLEGINTMNRVPIEGAFGAMEPNFTGNGSPEGHQALAGHIVEDPYQLFDETGFPTELVEIVRAAAQSVLRREVEVVRNPGTDDVPGIDFIARTGECHLESLDPSKPFRLPIYASSDSLVQIALSQDVVPQATIRAVGEAVREALDRSSFRVARVIMRPFIGGPGTFERVSKDRIDFGVDPDQPTLIDHFTKAKIPVWGVGKAPSMFNGRGFQKERIFKGADDKDRIERVAAWFDVTARTTSGFMFANLVATDELWGHPRKPKEYVEHLNGVSGVLEDIQSCMTPRDLLIVTSDHGNDPTQTKHRNHTRERVPLLVFSPGITGPVNLGIRGSFADLAATFAENFGLRDKLKTDTSFLDSLRS
mgnify:CR=1 FL=1